MLISQETRDDGTVIDTKWVDRSGDLNDGTIIHDHNDGCYGECKITFEEYGSGIQIIWYDTLEELNDISNEGHKSEYTSSDLKNCDQSGWEDIKWEIIEPGGVAPGSGEAPSSKPRTITKKDILAILKKAYNEGTNYEYHNKKGTSVEQLLKDLIKQELYGK